jgi:hypothetical protein
LIELDSAINCIIRRNVAVLCMGISEGAVHGTWVYSAGVNPNGPSFERFPDLKKKKKKKKKRKKFTFGNLKG